MKPFKLFINGIEIEDSFLIDEHILNNMDFISSIMDGLLNNNYRVDGIICDGENERQGEIKCL